MITYARDVKHLQRAMEAARSSSYRWQHGCVIAKGNRVIAVKPNKFKNTTKNVAYTYGSVTSHAEYEAIKGC